MDFELEGLPSRGTVHSVVIFASFAGEAAWERPPDYAARLFDPDLPGGLTHFYDEMSHGQLRLTGQVFGRVYASRDPMASYLAAGAGELGQFGRFAREILEAADGGEDFGSFDNDGPDGVPNSGDDDGYVDYVFIIMPTTPAGFVVDDADGIGRLGLVTDYVTDDEAAGGGHIRVRSDDHHAPGGSIQRGRGFAAAVGAMAHEFGHVLGLPDLYDAAYATSRGSLDPAEDSGGIGYWGLMGHGNRGWYDVGGPNPLCAWSREQLGWLGVDNENLVLHEGGATAVTFRDVNDGGAVYKLPGEGAGEYFLVEHRAAGASYYERDLPAEGLLIWRVNPRGANDAELEKLVDLVCADGLYRDAGFPRGGEAAPDGGRDNLDYWAHDATYREAHAGNLGDATDPFDGVVYTEYSPVTNPASRGISVSHIRREPGGMSAVLNARDPRRLGVIAGDEVWSGAVEIVGDIWIPRGSRLTVYPGTEVRIGDDHRRGGADPLRCEVIVAGDLIAVRGSRPAIFTSAFGTPAAGDWRGIEVVGGGRAELNNVTVEYAVDGLYNQEDTGPLALRDVTFRRPAESGVRWHSDRAPVRLEGVAVVQAGGSAMWLEGTAPTQLVSPTIAGSAGSGLVRLGGPITCTAGQFQGNGVDSPGAASMLLGTRVAGSVTGNYFRGGVGIRCLGSEDVVLADNVFVEHRVSIISEGSRPEIVANRFTGSALVLRVRGERLPGRFELNTVVDAAQLVVNESPALLEVKRNWWGRSDPAWIADRMVGPVVWEPSLTFDPSLPVELALEQNYPNPFCGSTTIQFAVGVADFTVSGEEFMTVEIRSITGRRVRRLLEAPAFPGIYSLVWDGRGDVGQSVASGPYYCELRVGPVYLRRRLALIH